MPVCPLDIQSVCLVLHFCYQAKSQSMCVTVGASKTKVKPPPPSSKRDAEGMEKKQEHRKEIVKKAEKGIPELTKSTKSTKATNSHPSKLPVGGTATRHLIVNHNFGIERVH